MNTENAVQKTPVKSSSPNPAPSIQQTAPPKRLVKRGGRGLGTTSIKKALKGEFEDEQKQLSAKEQFKLYSKADEIEPFDQDQLTEKWNAFLPRLDDRPSLKATLSTLPEIQEDWTLLLPVDNRIQDELLVSVKPELISFLRKELRNSKINLKTVVTDIKHEKIIYSDIEKYQEMAKKNPNLALLKRTLNLDF
ncbi:hypothetical protein [uncultured Draconibacterium sp.]|uniref:hypothetical protein n=1 Tax=uncultured Draconibacterium sp. TaxID=1573823 RepID=UPI0025EE17AE|nr:hypothetical protein [uncultured Draconibacterium sp.]